MPGDGSDSDEEYNAASFWRAPIGPAPEIDPSPAPAPAAAPSSSVQRPAVMINPAPRPGFEHIAPAPIAVEDLSTAEIKSKLQAFEANFKMNRGRPITLADAKELPDPILALYDQLGRRLNPAELARANEVYEARTAEAATKAAERAAAKEARAKEWEAKKAEAWNSAKGSARSQREDDASRIGLDGPEVLSGAASWIKVEETKVPTMPTREQYLQQVLDSRPDWKLPAQPDES